MRRWFLIYIGFLGIVTSVYAQVSPTMLFYIAHNEGASEWYIHWVSVRTDDADGYIIVDKPIRAIAIPPTGTMIVYVTWDNRISLLNILTGQTYMLSDMMLYHLDGLYGAPTQITWSPDATQLAFVGISSQGTPHLYIHDTLSATTTNLTETFDTNRMFYPRWSPDGTRIAFLTYSTDMQMYHAWTVDIFHLNITALAPDMPACALYWSPDGLYIASLLTCTDPIGVVTAESSQIQVFVPSQNTTTGLLDPQPYSRLVAIGWQDTNTLITFRDTHRVGGHGDERLIEAIAIDMNTGQTHILHDLATALAGVTGIHTKYDWVLWHSSPVTNQRYAYHIPTGELINLTDAYNCNTLSIELVIHDSIIIAGYNCDEFTPEALQVYDYRARDVIYQMSIPDHTSLTLIGLITITP